MKRQKKAFTLTELLVVVVIIGVLSAVVLPKFSKMLNTRRTTEAEDIMSAVRQEQEYRCASDKNYTTAKTDLSSLASLPDSLSSKNYTYTLGGSGITATAKKGSYNLQMPSYEDGRICCDGDGCNDLNKEYIACGSIPASSSGCEVDEPEAAQPVAVCTEGEVKGRESCSTCGGVRTTQKCVNGAWTYSLGECSIDQSSCSCELVSGPQPANQTGIVCNSCGTKNITYSCNTTNWTWTKNESACSVSAGNCTCNEAAKPSTTRECSSCGGTQTQSVTCDGNTGQWQELGNWSECSKPESECVTCEDDQRYNCLLENGPQFYAPGGYVAGNWNENNCSCSCPAGYTLQESGMCYSCVADLGSNLENERNRCSSYRGIWADGERGDELLGRGGGCGCVCGPGERWSPKKHQCWDIYDDSCGFCWEIIEY